MLLIGGSARKEIATIAPHGRADFVDLHDLGQPCAKTRTFGCDQKRGGVFSLSDNPSARFCARAVLEPSVRIRHLSPVNGLGEVLAPCLWRPAAPDRRASLHV